MNNYWTELDNLIELVLNRAEAVFDAEALEARIVEATRKTVTFEVSLSRHNCPTGAERRFMTSKTSLFRNEPERETTFGNSHYDLTTPPNWSFV